MIIVLDGKGMEKAEIGYIYSEKAIEKTDTWGLWWGGIGRVRVYTLRYIRFGEAIEKWST